MAAWACVVFSLERTNAQLHPSAGDFLANAALGYLVFLVAVLLEGHVSPVHAFSLLARRSYSLYLVHVPVGFTVLLLVGETMPYTLALLLAFLATGLATELSYRIVEKPSIALGRRIATRLRRSQSIESPTRVLAS